MWIATILIGLVVLLWIGWRAMGRMGGIDHQVKYYVKNYAKYLRDGLTHEQAIDKLVAFYSATESKEKQDLMKDRMELYYSNFDYLVIEIMIFYYSNDPTEQNLGIDEGSQTVATSYIFTVTTGLLEKYKQIYLKSA